ncbi:MAG: hypothetical protein IJS78_07130 [Clostridia bacterium]|nr:hypothetical protein [Clostridia bacterium]
MGLLSKLFGGEKAVEKAAKDILGGILGQNNGGNANERPAETAAPVREDTYGGDSVWDRMPAEENQYNFGGTYSEYFESLFRSEFPAYRFEKTPVGGSGRLVYTFYGSSRALVVELMSERCSAYKVRNDCRRDGVPYLRFYYDHAGWWNTRSYVVGRIGEYLK